MSSTNDIVWGEPFYGTSLGKAPEGYQMLDPVQVYSKKSGAWSTINYPGLPAWSRFSQYRLPADHPYYKPKLSPVEQAFETLKAEGYTVDETTGVLSPPDKMQEAREFVAEIYDAINYQVLAKNLRNGHSDRAVKSAIKFLNENKHRIPKNTENT